jgi:RNA12 protein
LITDDSSRSISVLGGRLTDLETLVQKVRSGLDIGEAVDDIVSRSQTEIQKSVFGDDDFEEGRKYPWTHAQAWFLVKQLSKQDDVSRCLGVNRQI